MRVSMTKSPLLKIKGEPYIAKSKPPRLEQCGAWLE